MCPADAMEGAGSGGEAAARHLSRRRPRPGQGDEADRGAAEAVDDLAEVRYHHQTESGRPAGRIVAAARLRAFGHVPAKGDVTMNDGKPLVAVTLLVLLGVGSGIAPA